MNTTSLQRLYALPDKAPATKEYRHKVQEKRLCTFDIETDGFKYGRLSQPFTCGFYDSVSDQYYDWWGKNCIRDFFNWLAKAYEPDSLVIYVHNGGRFDFLYMADYIDAGVKPFFINGSLIRIQMQGQEFRDSLAAIPVALDNYRKSGEQFKQSDYAEFEKGIREQYKDLIRQYQKDDCIFLAEFIGAWVREFGDKLTMASVALPKMLELHGVRIMNEYTDRRLRPFYFGGRVECFETGVLDGDWKIYDVTSMYPFVMKAYKHPVSSVPILGNAITDETAFARITAISRGVLPLRTPQGLFFPNSEEPQEFFACIHEIRAGLKHKTLEIIEVHETYDFLEWADFSTFVDTYFARRQEAKAKEEEAGAKAVWAALCGNTQGSDYETSLRDYYKQKAYVLFWKLVLNSAYGKLAQDPRKYKDYIFNPKYVPTPQLCTTCTDGECPDCMAHNTAPDGWSKDTERNGLVTYSRPTRIRYGSFFNVAAAASITSAARAELYSGIKGAERVVYCDTDSLICERIGPVSLGSGLGSWKLEGTGNTVCIGGKKLYVVFDDETVVKQASKGGRLTAEEIEYIANGGVVDHEIKAMKMKWDGSAVPIRRTFTKTDNREVQWDDFEFEQPDDTEKLLEDAE